MLELVLNILVYVLIGVLLYEVHPNLAYAMATFIGYQYYMAIHKQIMQKRMLEKLKAEFDKQNK